jgi:hypothetical protein
LSAPACVEDARVTPGLPYFQQMFFGPDAIRAMDAAFDKACRSLHDAGQPEIVKEVIAKRIISLACDGERDPDRLCDETLKALRFAQKLR